MSQSRTLIDDEKHRFQAYFPLETLQILQSGQNSVSAKEIQNIKKTTEFRAKREMRYNKKNFGKKIARIFLLI